MSLLYSLRMICRQRFVKTQTWFQKSAMYPSIDAKLFRRNCTNRFSKGAKITSPKNCGPGTRLYQCRGVARLCGGLQVMNPKAAGDYNLNLETWVLELVHKQPFLGEKVQKQDFF